MAAGRVRVLDQHDVAAVVARVGLDQFVDELIERLVETLSDDVTELLATQPRAGFDYEKPGVGLVEWMPAMELGRRVAVKTVGYHPSNPSERSLPTVFASTALYDTTAGRLLALCDATLLTALRTGAASAVATDILGREGSVHLGVIGCGAQSVAQIHAISRVRNITDLTVYDASADTANSLGERLGPWVPDLPVQVVSDPETVVGSADVLCTATSVDVGVGPVFRDVEHEPWLHINAVGSDFPGRIELPRPLLERARVFPDYVPQCLVEGEAQNLTTDQLDLELPCLVAQRENQRHARHELTVFDSTGWAVEDLVAADLALAHAEAHDIGAEIALNGAVNDPYDPFELLTPALGT